MVLKGSEWKEKAEKLELEIQQCYKAQAQLSEQLVVEVAELRSSKALIQEKDSMISDLQNELTKSRFVLFITLFPCLFFFLKFVLRGEEHKLSAIENSLPVQK